MDRMIRLDNKFVVKIKNKYYLTSISNVSDWRKMNNLEREEKKGKEVTSKVKKYLRLYKTPGNINIKTKPSVKKLRTIKKPMTMKQDITWYQIQFYLLKMDKRFQPVM